MPNEPIDPAANPPAEPLKEVSAIDMTQLAREQAYDPMIGRDEEIRRVIHVLTRRFKNNPLLIGEAGVGKTAVVEGLANLIARGEVPERLRHKRLLSVEMSSLVAGTTYRGQFEQRLKQLVETLIKNDEIILFIDELHLIVGAGATSEGGMDVANILKPHLARGTIQCIGATTFAEHSKYIEKDQALTRRFQKIIIAEPSVPDAIAILRGLRERFETYHRIQLRDSALVAAAELSHRYIPERRLPDKAIDLIDECLAAKRMEIDSTPLKLQEMEEKIARLEMERASLEKDKSDANDRQFNQGWAALADSLRLAKEERDQLHAQWERSIEEITRRQEFRELIQSHKLRAEAARQSKDVKRAIEIEQEEIIPMQQLLDQEIAESDERSRKEQRQIKPENPFELCAREITGKDIEKLVAKWTGIPLQKLQESEAERLLQLDEQLSRKVIGQDRATSAVAAAIRIARSGLNDPNRPIATFLFLGPTGVGKTETAKVLTDTVFGETSSLIRLDMSEYTERYTVSRLIGASPGYIGYEEGGQLSEAVRNKPFACVLFDEIEKAHPTVFNLLLQILDEGRLTDARGRHINFKNTIIILTSNIGSEFISQTNGRGKEAQEEAGRNPQKSDFEHSGIDALPKQLQKELLSTFRPELLNRIDEVVLFSPLKEEDLLAILDLQIDALNCNLRAMDKHISLTQRAKKWLATVSYSAAYGARPLRRCLEKRLKAPLSTLLLKGELNQAHEILVDVNGSDELVFKMNDPVRISPSPS